MLNAIRKNALYLAWATALAATAGSLYFSEVLHLPPCVLCWYQRVFMYPLVLLLAVGIERRDPGIRRYALPLSLLGFAVAVYHNLLYYKILPENAAPCTAGISCTTLQINWLGFITIPLLSLLGFLAINLALIIYQPEENNDQRN